MNRNNIQKTKKQILQLLFAIGVLGSSHYLFCAAAMPANEKEILYENENEKLIIDENSQKMVQQIINELEALKELNEQKKELNQEIIKAMREEE